MNDKKTILIVEDEKDLVEWLTVFFNENGYNVISAFDGADGFDKAEKQKPDLITLDISMPGESGAKMYHKLIRSEATKDIPIIVLTNLESMGDVEKALELGATTYLVKASYTLEDVVQKIKKALGE